MWRRVSRAIKVQQAEHLELQVHMLMVTMVVVVVMM